MVMRLTAASCRSRLVSALTTLLCILIPLLRVLFNVFPFTPNRWFGLGFLLYYLICTPLLYRVIPLEAPPLAMAIGPPGLHSGCQALTGPASVPR